MRLEESRANNNNRNKLMLKEQKKMTGFTYKMKNKLLRLTPKSFSKEAIFQLLLKVAG